MYSARQLRLTLFSCLLLQALFGYSQILPIESRISPEDFIEYNHAIYTDEFMLIHKDSLIQHWVNPDCDSTFMNTASMVKSWTAIVIGAIIEDGLIESVDDPVCDYVPDWKDGCEHDVRIKHLLSMSAGIDKKRGAAGILAAENVNDYATKVRLDTMPGIRFNYSNAGVQLLALVIQAATGDSVDKAFAKYLFNPLSMHSSSLYHDAVGNAVVFGGARTTVSDAAKVARMMINKEGHRSEIAVSDEWLKSCIRPSENADFYGYLWWIDNRSKHFNYAAMGDFGQLTVIFPDLDLIYVRRQSCNKQKSGNMTFMGPQFLELIASTVL